MLFKLEVLFLRTYMAIFKVVTMVLPFKWPTNFEGADASLELCRHVAKQGHKKALIVTDSILLELGIIDPIKAELEKNGLATAVYDGVRSDPNIEQIEGGYEKLRAENCDCIVAVGGGSSIDAAKVIGARAKNDKSIQKMAGLFRVFRGMLPLYVVPTTAGTGSEVTIAAVVSDPVQERKLPIMDLKLMPTAAAIDGKIMAGMPAPITAATGMDALTHAVEAYVSRNAFAETDKLALEAAQLIVKNLPLAYADGSNVEARQAMALGSNLAGKAFTQAGVGYVHAIAHNFGALYHTPHGLANAIVMPYVLEYSIENCSEKLANLARACDIGPADGNDMTLAKAFIAKIREMKTQFDIPEKLDALTEKDIPRIATAALKEARFTYAVPRYMDQSRCEAVVGQMLAA